MKKIYFLVLAIAVLIMAGCSSENSKQEIKEIPAVAVVTQPIIQKDFPVTVRVGGTLRGDRQTAIVSKVVGTVIAIPVRVGQTVKKGDLLIKLDPGGVQSQYHQAEAVYTNAEKQFNKMDNLYKAGAVSEAQRDATETEYKVAQANFDAARQGVEIEAPFSGTVADIHIRTGDEVGQGMPLIEVADIKDLRLILDVPTSQVGLLMRGQNVKVTSPQDENLIMEGEIVSVADVANKVKRSFEVDCRFSNPPDGFAPGVYLMGEVSIDVLNQVLTVPNEALLYRGGKAYVYAVNTDIANFIPVEVLATDNESAAIAGDVTVNQKVVTIGHKNLTPGTKVTEAGQ